MRVGSRMEDGIVESWFIVCLILNFFGFLTHPCRGWAKSVRRRFSFFFSSPQLLDTQIYTQILIMFSSHSVLNRQMQSRSMQMPARYFFPSSSSIPFLSSPSCIKHHSSRNYNFNDIQSVMMDGCFEVLHDDGMQREMMHIHSPPSKKNG